MTAILEKEKMFVKGFKFDINGVIIKNRSMNKYKYLILILPIIILFGGVYFLLYYGKSNKNTLQVEKGSPIRLEISGNNPK